MNKFISLLILTSVFTASVRADGPVSLDQCYRQARGQSETLRLLEESIHQSQARARVALADALPNVSWNLKETFQDTTGLPDDPFTNSFFEKRQTETKFSASQPLFSGGKLAAARRGFQREVFRDQSLLRREEVQLYQNVSDAYFDVLGAEAALSNTQAALILAEERIEELKRFRRLGKARASELYAAQSQASSLKADVIAQENLVNERRQDLALLVGEEVMNLPLVDPLFTADGSMTLEVFLEKSQTRSDLAAQRADVEAQSWRVKYEQGRYWPSADVSGNYYTRRPLFMKEIDWDADLTVNFPLYQGGGARAQVAQAQSLRQQSRWFLAKKERNVRYEVRRDYNAWRTAQKETVARQEAYDAAHRNYESLKEEYRLGLVTNLEVLQALSTVHAEHTLWDNARFEIGRRWVQLQVSSGNTP